MAAPNLLGGKGKGMTVVAKLKSRKFKAFSPGGRGGKVPFHSHCRLLFSASHVAKLPTWRFFAPAWWVEKTLRDSWLEKSGGGGVAKLSTCRFSVPDWYLEKSFYRHSEKIARPCFSRHLLPTCPTPRIIQRFNFIKMGGESFLDDARPTGLESQGGPEAVAEQAATMEAVWCRFHFLALNRKENRMSLSRFFTIRPYRWENQWVFDDPQLGLEKAPLITGTDTIIDLATAFIENADKGFLAVFSNRFFPDSKFLLEWVREENGGNVYNLGKWNEEGLLCPALFRYFAEVPKKIYLQVKEIPAGK